MKFKILRLCKTYILKYKVNTLSYIVLGCFLSVFSIFVPYITGKFIDSLVKGEGVSCVYKFCSLLVLLSCCKIICNYFSKIIYTKIHTLMAYNLNVDILNHLKKLPLSYFKNANVVYLNQRINSDANSVMSFALSSVVDIIYNLIITVGITVLIIKIDFKIFFSIIILICIYFMSYKLFKNPLYNKGLDFKENQGEFFSKLNEQLFQIKFLKINSLEHQFTARLNTSFNKLFKSAMKYQKVSCFFSSCDTTILALSQIVLFFIGGIEVAHGNISIGLLTIISSYFSSILDSIRYFFNFGKSYQDNLISYDRIMEILNTPVQYNGLKIIENIDEIVIKDLEFSYGEKLIFNNFNFQFEKGNIYCLAGDNGIGKSTLTNIIIGLHTSEFEGEILYNDNDMDGLDVVRIRKNLCGVTEQETILINDTIYNNITLGVNKFRDEHLQELLDILNLNSYINSLPEKMNTVINEDCTNISGGEKQKVSILRTLLKDPIFLILDEPTSALDYETKVNIINYLKKIKDNKIIMIITHDEYIKNEADIILNFNNIEELNKYKIIDRL